MMNIRIFMIFLGFWLLASLAKGDALNARLDAEYIYKQNNAVITAAPRGTKPHQFFGVQTQGASTTDSLVTMANFSSVAVTVGQTYTALEDATAKSRDGVLALGYSAKVDTEVDDVGNHNLGWYSTDLTNSSCVVDAYGYATIRVKGAFNLSDPRVDCYYDKTLCAFSYPSNGQGRIVASRSNCTTGISGPGSSTTVVNDGIATIDDTGYRTLVSDGDYYCFEAGTMDADNYYVAWTSLSIPCNTAK